MHIMKSIYIILFSIILMSCNNNDDTTTALAFGGEIDIEGSWNLVNVSGGSIGVNQDFEIGTIIWDFDTSAMVVSVMNTSEITGFVDEFPTGIYPYGITPNGNDTNSLIVNEINLGILRFPSSDSFTVNLSFIDGFDITFER